MATDKTIGRITGALFLAGMAAWGLGFGLIEPVTSAAQPLSVAAARRGALIAGVLFELLNALLVIGIAVMLVPLLRREAERLALAYLALRVLEAAVLVMAALAPLMLLTLASSAPPHAAGAPTAEALGTLVLEARYRLGQSVPVFVGGSGLLLAAAFYRTRLVPHWLAGWGLLGYGLVAVGFPLELQGHTGTALGLLLGAPAGTFELALAGWLLWRGFPPAGNAPRNAV